MHVQFVGDPFHFELAPYQILSPTKQKWKLIIQQKNSERENKRGVLFQKSKDPGQLVIV